MEPKTGYHTRAQKELLAYMTSTPGTHHTAAEVKEYFSAKGIPIGLATVYRQLEKLVEEGSVRRYVTGAGESACYAYEEGQGGCRDHFHCKCEKCGRLIHMDCDELQEIRAHLLADHGFRWNTGKTVFYGICDRCMEDRETAEQEG